jgi:Uma2 family endonuclease
MSVISLPAPDHAVFYPERDGKPVADNTLQFQWIVVLFGNLTMLFADRADVFIAADLLWYPVRGEPKVSTAPDILVVFGRPKGHRDSYRQWEEDDVPVTVAFEILSPGNTPVETFDKQLFYEEHGVEEYYVYDPDKNRLFAHRRRGDMLRPVRPEDGYVSPRLGIRFDLSGPELVVHHPEGRPFQTFSELDAQRRLAEQRAETERRRADLEHQRAEDEQKQAEEARRQADAARRQAEDTNRRASRMAALARKARQNQASPEELQEMERLETEFDAP